MLDPLVVTSGLMIFDHGVHLLSLVAFPWELLVLPYILIQANSSKASTVQRDRWTDGVDFISLRG